MRASAAGWVRSTSYERVFFPAVGAGAESMATMRPTRSSSSSEPIRLLPRNPVAPVTATERVRWLVVVGVELPARGSTMAGRPPGPGRPLEPREPDMWEREGNRPC
jgi:hypothetical protein